jgi:hypothetical protein
MSRTSWGAIWSGLFVAAGVVIVMSLFGVAIGISALASRPDAQLGVGLWTAIWSVITTLSALFFAGWTASAMSAPLRRVDSILVGLVTWAFAVTLGALTIGLLPDKSFGELKSSLAVGAAWATFATVLCGLGLSILGAFIGASERPAIRAPGSLETREV